MKMNGVSFRHAVELLREGDPALPPPAGEDSDGARKLPAAVSLRCRRRSALLTQVIGYYHETLEASPEALAYLKARGHRSSPRRSSASSSASPTARSAFGCPISNREAGAADPRAAAERRACCAPRVTSTSTARS